jgi:hypothetical protein
MREAWHRKIKAARRRRNKKILCFIDDLYITMNKSKKNHRERERKRERGGEKEKIICSSVVSRSFN